MVLTRTAPLSTNPSHNITSLCVWSVDAPSHPLYTQPSTPDRQ
jgi:hypothetical protein